MSLKYIDQVTDSLLDSLLIASALPANVKRFQSLDELLAITRRQ